MQTAIASLIHQHILFFYVILKSNCEVIQIFAKNFREFGHHILLLREVNVWWEIFKEVILLGL